MRRHIILLTALAVSSGVPATAATYGKQAGSGGGQDPSTVQITGGTITGVNTATRSAQGAMASADKAFLDDFDGWKKTQYARMVAADPNLTAYEAYPAWINPIGTMVTQATNTAFSYDANLEGGWVTPANGDMITYGASVFQNTPGGHWAVAFEVQVALPTTGVDGDCGLKNAAFSNWLALGSINSWDATNWQLRIKGAGTATQVTTTTAVTTGTHDIMISDDGTTVKAWIDGVQAGSTTARTQLVATPMQIVCENTTSGQMKIHRIAYGYVRP